MKPALQSGNNRESSECQKTKKPLVSQRFRMNEDDGARTRNLRRDRPVKWGSVFRPVQLNEIAKWLIYKALQHIAMSIKPL